MHYILLLFLSLVAYTINAQDTLKNRFAVSADLSPFYFNGYSAKVSYLPKKHPKTELAVEVFSMKIPDVVINLNKENTGKGWLETIKLGTAIYFDKKIGSKRNSFWMGGGLVLLNHEVQKLGIKNTFQQLEYLARINYKYYPFKTINFYLNPYFAIAARHKVNGSNGDYQLTPLLIIPSVYVSWEF